MSDSLSNEPGGPPRRHRRRRRRREPGEEGSPLPDTDLAPGLPPRTDELPPAPRRTRLPRHELLHPTPIPGRLRGDDVEDYSALLNELAQEGPPPAEHQEVRDAPPPRREGDERGAREGRGSREGRGGRGARGGRDRDNGPPRDGPPRAEAEPRRDEAPREPSPYAAPAPVQAPARAPAPVRAPEDDNFGAGLFDEPATPAVVTPEPVPAAEEPPTPQAPEPQPAAPEPEEEDDGFGAGILD